jgi:CheY-like chemotaxis protein
VTQQLKPVLLLLDIKLHRAATFDATRRIEADLPGTKVLPVHINGDPAKAQGHFKHIKR